MNKKKIVIRGAAKTMQRLCKSGFYKRMKQLENRVEQLKEVLRTRRDHKRSEFPSIGVICKYQAYNVYETNKLGLNDFLNDLGILPVVVKIDNQMLLEHPDVISIIEKYQNPVERYMRFTPNKLGKVETEQLETDYLEDIEIAKMWLISKKQLDKLQEEYEKHKESMGRSRLLKKERKLPCAFGTVSLIDKRPTFNIEKMYEELGAGFLMQYAKADMQLLDEFMVMGFLNAKEINCFRKIIGVELRFLVTDKETEDRQFRYFQSRLRRSSKNRIAL